MATVISKLLLTRMIESRKLFNSVNKKEQDIAYAQSDAKENITIVENKESKREEGDSGETLYDVQEDSKKSTKASNLSVDDNHINGGIIMENERKEQNPFIGITDVGQAEDILNQFQRDNPDDIDGAEKILSAMLEALFMPNVQLTGDADNFHNFAVIIARVTNDNKNTLRIIKEGLKIHDKNTDLLADAITYGLNCGEKDACNVWYRTLLSIDKSRWTWRAFSFTIDYLLEIYTSNESDDFSVDDILKLTKEYQMMKPDEEDAWVCEYKIYESTNRINEGIKVLENAMEIFRFCPKCWLRYADIMMDRGDYEKAEPVIKKMRRNPKTGEAINISYMFYLDGLCKMTKLMDTDEYEEGEIDERAVYRIYKSFQIALSSSGLRENTKRQIDEHLSRLTKETGIDYPVD